MKSEAIMHKIVKWLFSFVYDLVIYSMRFAIQEQHILETDTKWIVSYFLNISDVFVFKPSVVYSDYLKH